MKWIFCIVLLVFLGGCGLRQREIELNKKMNELNQREQQLNLREQSIDLKEQQLNLRFEVYASLLDHRLRNAWVCRFPIPGVLNYTEYSY